MDQYIGEVRMFAGAFAPNGWADCNGQLLPVTRYNTLFSIIGVTYGGDGRTTFAVPNLNGRAPMHPGTGPGLTPRALGDKGGEATVELVTSQMPAHTHVAQALNNQGTLSNPSGAVWTKTPKSGRTPVDTPGFAHTPNAAMNPLALAPTGAGQAHNNMQPYLPVRFIIALEGNYPSRP